MKNMNNILAFCQLNIWTEQHSSNPPTLHPLPSQCFQPPICKSSLVHFTPSCLSLLWPKSESHFLSYCESETQPRDKKLGYQLGYLVFSFSLTLLACSLFFLVLLINALTFQYMKGSMRWKGKEEQLVYLLSFIIAICRMQRKYI